MKSKPRVRGTQGRHHLHEQVKSLLVLEPPHRADHHLVGSNAEIPADLFALAGHPNKRPMIDAVRDDGDGLRTRPRADELILERRDVSVEPDTGSPKPTMKLVNDLREDA